MNLETSESEHLIISFLECLLISGLYSPDDEVNDDSKNSDPDKHGQTKQ